MKFSATAAIALSFFVCSGVFAAPVLETQSTAAATAADSAAADSAAIKQEEPLEARGLPNSNLLSVPKEHLPAKAHQTVSGSSSGSNRLFVPKQHLPSKAHHPAIAEQAAAAKNKMLEKGNNLADKLSGMHL